MIVKELVSNLVGSCKQLELEAKKEKPTIEELNHLLTKVQEDTKAFIQELTANAINDENN